MLSEEALILAAVAAAGALLVLGVLELVWPTRSRHARRPEPELTPPRPSLAAVPPRSAQSILPRRLVDSPAASRPAGGFVFPPPADYVPPPRPREEARPVLPVGSVVSERFSEPEPAVAPPAPVYIAPPEPVYVAPPAVEVEPTPIDPEPAVVEVEPLTLEPERPPEPERQIVAAASSLVEPVAKPTQPEPPQVDIAPPAVEPAMPEVEPERRPIEHIAPSFEPVPSPSEDIQPPPQPAEPSEALKRRRRSKISPHARPHRVLRPATQEKPRAEQPPTSSAPPAPIEAPMQTPVLGRDTPLVERCFALYQEKRFGEVLSVAEPALAEIERQPTAGTPRETAALWSVVGLAKQARGDDDGAHAALESAIASAAEPERSTYRRHLATLALEVAQARLARADSHDGGDRIAVIRTAIAWTERGLAAVPADTALTDAGEASHEALWQAYEQAASALLQRQEFSGARQILHAALDDPKLPAARAAGFRGLISGTFGGEIGQLTAQAILGMQEGRESEAVGALQRAEELLRTIPTEALPPTRRAEVDQRLWWGYAELGSRRLDAGDYEEALDPLIHALRFASIGPERQAETRAAVVRTLEGIAAVRALSIRRLAEAGSRDEAIGAAGDLHGLVKRGLELGLSEDDLMAAFARVRRLCEELGMDTRA